MASFGQVFITDGEKTEHGTRARDTGTGHGLMYFAIGNFFITLELSG